MPSITQFYKQRHKNDNGWYLLPRAIYFNQRNLEKWHKILKYLSDNQFISRDELRTYQPKLDDDLSSKQAILRAWTQDEQMKLLDWMIREEIIQPYAQNQSPNDRLANVRNHLNLLEKLGFGFINSEKHLFISPVGDKFLRSDQSEWHSILQKQLIRIQLWNPSLLPAAWNKYKVYHLFPYLFTLMVLLQLEPSDISQNEFCRILAYAYSVDELDFIVELIMDYRTLPQYEKDRVDSVTRLSVPQKISAAVHMQAFGLTPGLEYRESALHITNRSYVENLVKFYEPRLKYVDFDNFNDWYQSISEEELGIPIYDLLKYYIETGKEEKAKAVLEETSETSSPSETRTLEQLLNDLLVERALEDVLENNLNLLELDLKLVANGRQYTTEVGRIDLLAKDHNDAYVVVELKKDIVEDKVIGQTLRYMGWVRANLSPNKEVRGIIAGRELTPKLKMAVLGLQTEYPLIQLKQFQVNVSANVLEVNPQDS